MAIPLPVDQWRKQVFMVAGGQISLYDFIRRMGNQEGAHADEVVDQVLANVARSLMIRVGGQRPEIGPAYVIAMAEYVAKRARTLLKQRSAGVVE